MLIKLTSKGTYNMIANANTKKGNYNLNRGDLDITSLNCVKIHVTNFQAFHA